MNRLLTTYLIIVALTISNLLPGQNQSMRFNHLDVEDGLPENTIKATLQDSEGFMWFATWNGLCRYDGYEFKVYKHINGDSTSLRVNKITCLLEDHEKRLWVGTLGGGLSLYNKEKENFTNFVHDPKNEFSIFSNQILTISEDSKNRIWVGLNQAGVSLIDINNSSDPSRDNNFRFIHFGNDPENKNSFTGNVVTSIVEDTAGTVWFGSNDGSIVKLIHDQNSYDNYRFISFRQQSENSAKNYLNIMNVDKFYPELFWIDDKYEGIIWFDTRSEKFIYEYPDVTLKKHIPINDIQSMLITGNGEYWFGTNGDGIYSFKPNNNEKVEHYKIISNVNSTNTDPANIINIYEDASGLIWIGTYNNGIFTYQKRAKEFISYDFNNSQLNEKVLHVYEDKDGILWICTTAGLKKYDPVSQEHTHFKHNPTDKGSINSNVVYTAIRDSSGTLWVGTNKGLDKYDPFTNTFTHFFHDANDPNSISKGLIINTFIDSKGTLWIGGWGGGLNKPTFSSKGKVEKFLHYRKDANDPNSISDNSIMNFAESKDGTLWIGTAYGGLNKLVSDYQFAEDGSVIKPTFRSFQSNPNDPNSISGNDVRSICIDQNGTFWLGTFGGGLNRFKPPESENDPVIFSHYRQSDGLANDVVKCVYQDDIGRLWISTSYGLSMFNPVDNSFSNFYVSDGLKIDKFGGVYYKSNKTGRLYFGGDEGLISFIPENIKPNDYKPKIAITSFKTYNAKDNKMAEVKGMPYKKKITLSYQDNILNFEFAALNFYNSSQNKYAYKLQGYNDNWIQLGNKRDVTFTNLDPGEYNLLVRGSNNDGIWNETGIALEIIIKPPWWQSTTAFVMYGLLIIIVLIFIDRYQRKRLQEKARAKAREKELKQAKEIKKAYDKLRTTQSQLVHAEKMASLGELTAGIAHEIQNPLNFVNNFSDVSVDLIDELDEELATGNTEEIKSISNDLKQNLEKIHHHGQRASGIVKGMLDHSRTGNNEKQPTDINAIVDEYIRLAYHGIRAKDKSFNADYKTDLDENLPKARIVGQDIARVILNLINNAFYAVSSKALSTDDSSYKPSVTVITKDLDNIIEIRVKDNGNGIPDEIKDKIFQPFFTTKASGEGTGLGLSLSYDIITKGHGGTIKVETIEGEGTEFIIQLPV